MLLFKKKFLAAIAAGEKTQTIRLWKFRKMRPGQRSYIPGVGYIGILAVDEVALDGLTDADALPDGFPTADALRAEIQALYGRQLAGGSRDFSDSLSRARCGRTGRGGGRAQGTQGRRVWLARPWPPTFRPPTFWSGTGFQRCSISKKPWAMACGSATAW